MNEPTGPPTEARAAEGEFTAAGASFRKKGPNKVPAKSVSSRPAGIGR
ncbi:hypothetical protein [Acidiphilium multivorum]|nr:hypothetical protein [Acidiphilium multivorum]